MNYTGIKKSRTMPLLPQIKKQIAYRKLRRGKPVSRFTKGTKNERKDKLHLVDKAKSLMAQTTPCADNAHTHNLILNEVLAEILLDDSDEYMEYNAPEVDACEVDACEGDACEVDACEVDACEGDACEIDTCEIQSIVVEKNERECSPIHMNLLENELEHDSKPIYNDSVSDTSDTEYKDVLRTNYDNDIFKIDEELDIVDSVFPFIN